MAGKVHSPTQYLFFGLVFIFAGVLWRLSLMGWYALSWEVFLPGLLICLGLALVISGFFREHTSSKEGGK